MKKLFAAFTLFTFITLLFTACASSSGSIDAGAGSAANANTVHMSDTNFTQSNITIKKGESVTLVDDTATVHIINNGTWLSNGTPDPKTEPGAPTVNVQFQGNDTHAIGPFNTAGTFQLYCTIHTNMNLTVIVK